MSDLRTENDLKALELIKKIDEKKAQLKVVENLAWKTNCKFNIPTVNTTNLRTINDLKQLQIAFAYIIKDRSSIEEAGKALGIETDATTGYTFCDYPYESWLHDFKNQAEITKYKTEIKKLESAKKLVEAKISEDKKNQLELDSVMKDLGL